MTESEELTLVRKLAHGALPVLLAMTALLLGAAASDCSEASVSGSCGEYLTWELDNGVLTISGTGAMTNYGTESDPIPPWNGTVEEIVIGQGVTYIGDSAFAGTGVRSLYLPNTLATIGASAFEGCGNLNKVTLPSSVRSIGTSAFRDCGSMRTFCVSQTSGLQSIGDQAFEGCRSMGNLFLPAGLVHIGADAFRGCVNAVYSAAADNPEFAVNGGMLLSKDLSAVIASSADLGTFCLIPSETAVICASAFEGRSSLQTVCVENGGSLRYICADAFSGCRSLKELDLKDCCIERIGSRAFMGCTSLTDMSLLNHAFTVGSESFRDSGLTGALDLSRVGELGAGAFSGCTGITSVTLGSRSVLDGIPARAFMGCTSVGSLSVAKGVGMSSIGESAFEGCTALSDAYDLKGTAVFGKNCFRGCPLNVIELGAGCTSVGEMAFGDNPGIQAVLIVSPDTQVAKNAFTPAGPCYICCAPGKVIEQDLGKGYFHYSYQTYEIRFHDKGSVISTVHVHYGENVPLPDYTPVKESDAVNDYIFAGWEGLDGNVPIMSDMDTHPVFDAVPRQCTVTWADHDGTVFFKEKLQMGETVELPSGAPYRSPGKETVYTFSGWNGYTEGMKVENDITLTAEYTESVRMYTVTFLDANGECGYSEEKRYGEEITAPSYIPVKEKDAEHTYEFGRWYRLSPGMTVTGDMSFRPVFDAIDNQFTVEFVSCGEVFHSCKYSYGQTIKKPRTEPYKIGDDDTTYRFVRWAGYSDNDRATCDIVYEAVFEENVRYYDVTYYDRTDVYKSYRLPYGSELPVPANPKDHVDARYVYSFTGWDGPDADKVTHSMRFEAVFEKTPISYTVTFVSEGAVVSSEEYRFGDAVIAPADPVKHEENGVKYLFCGWNGLTENTTVIGDMMFKAMFAPIDGDVPADVPEKTPEDVPDEIPEDVPGKTPGQIPEEVPEDVPEEIPERTPEDVPDEIPEEITEEAPETVPENVPGNVTVTFRSEGRILTQTSCAKGTVIDLPAEPVSAEGDGFVFSGWNGHTEGMRAYEDVIFDALFRQVLNADNCGETVDTLTLRLAPGCPLTVDDDALSMILEEMEREEAPLSLCTEHGCLLLGTDAVCSFAWNDVTLSIGTPEKLSPMDRRAADGRFVCSIVLTNADGKVSDLTLDGEGGAVVMLEFGEGTDTDATSVWHLRNGRLFGEQECSYSETENGCIASFCTDHLSNFVFGHPAGTVQPMKVVQVEPPAEEDEGIGMLPIIIGAAVAAIAGIAAVIFMRRR